MRINFFGDVCLHGIDPTMFAVDPALRAVIESARLNVANLECPLTHATERRPYKHVYLKALPVENPILDLFHTFTLANNHILDYQAQGLRDTIAFLTRTGKRYFGAGVNRRASFEPLRLELEGHKIALLGTSQWHAATRRAPGATPRALRPLLRRVGRLAADGYFVVVYAHWNYEYLDFPAPANRRFAQRLIDGGAHLIVASHPHVIQGFEEHRGRYVFHSLGNFVFGLRGKNDPRSHETFVLSLELERSRSYDFRIHPVATRGGGVALLQGAEADDLRKRLERISEPLRDERRYRKMFYAQAAGGANRISGEIRTMVEKQGLMYLLSRLHRVTLQDLKVKLHSALTRVAG
jgi:poly-gamma-glutamate synthesis protein (capsule biosynthesis protein)